MKAYYSLAEVADMLSVSKETLRRWDRNGKLKALREPMSNYRVYKKEQLNIFNNLHFLFEEEEGNYVAPKHTYKSIELFAGAGGLALGFEMAGLHHQALNENDKWAVATLRQNRPEWDIKDDDIQNVSFSHLKGQVDVVSGGFPCQAFSYAGKKMGLKDARGTLFYEYARIVKETLPPICIAENVRGLLSHDKGNTLQGMASVLQEIGYQVLPPKLLKAIYYKVPQKRERVIIVAIRKDIPTAFHFPKPYKQIYSIADALKKGPLFDSDVPDSDGAKYPENKAKVLQHVPAGGYWRDLPLDMQKTYMGKSYYLDGGKTGIARRMSWDEPSLTLTCSPAQKQTERCHPEDTRPFTVREYARLQTFPDEWGFAGSSARQYKQIGNAVPVNLAREIGYSVVRFLNDYYKKNQKE